MTTAGAAVQMTTERRRAAMLDGAQHFYCVQRVGNGLQVSAGKVQVDHRVFQLYVAEQQLNGAQVGACFQQVSCIGVSKQVGVNAFFDAGPLGRGLTGVPDHLGGKRLIRTPVVDGARKQPGLRLHPAPVLPQGLQQLRTERDVAVTSALAMLNVDEHGLAIDVFDLQVAHFAIPHARGIEHHQHACGPAGCWAESISRATSSTVRITGSRRGALG